MFKTGVRVGWGVCGKRDELIYGGASKGKTEGLYKRRLVVNEKAAKLIHMLHSRGKLRGFKRGRVSVKGADLIHIWHRNKRALVLWGNYRKNTPRGCKGTS